MTSLVVSLSEESATRARWVGHKAASLAQLTRAGFPVPPGFVVSGRAFAKSAEQVLGARWWEAGRGEQATEIRRRLEAVELEDELVSRIGAAYDQLTAGGAPSVVAVRSSSTAEDTAVTSCAGLQDSVLGVAGLDQVLGALRSVWASFWSSRAQVYLASLGRRGRPVLVGVIVQRLVPAEAAGVLFSVNPVTGAQNEIVINSSYGLGEPVLSGSVSPDTFVVDKPSLALRSLMVRPKTESLEARPAGTARVPVAWDRRQQPSLTEEQWRELAELGRRVEAHLGGPCDMEWAVAAGAFHVLQARPITACGEGGPARSLAWLQGETAGEVVADNQDVWTNANVGEALPGVATPLTWSIAAAYSERGFKRAFGALGCIVPEKASLVGRFHGRIYLNLTQFCEVLAQVPLVSPLALVELGGVRLPEGMALPPPRRTWQVARQFLQRLPSTVARLAAQNLATERQVEEVEKRVAEAAERMRHLELHRLSGGRLDDELGRVDALLEATGDTMLTCASNSLGSFLLVRLLIRTWLGESERGLERELLSGGAELESAKPGIALWHMAEALKREPSSLRLLLESELTQLRVSSFPEGSSLRRDLDSFQLAFGYRAVREAELMAPRWSEEPTMIFAALREYVRSGGPPPGRALEERRRATRESWARVEARLGRLRALIVGRLVHVARRYSRLRERLRARVTQVLGLYRVIALEVGRRLGEPQGAFFLTAEEVHSSLRRGSLPGDLDVAAVIAARRRRYERDRALPEPPPLFVGRPPLEERRPSVVPGARLEGLGASPGRVRGVARVLRDHLQAGELRAGEILVVSCADVGWSPLFLLAGALVTELGGVLSHAAVIAREYGVPAVFGVAGATDLIASGQELTVDGHAGWVVVH